MVCNGARQHGKVSIHLYRLYCTVPVQKCTHQLRIPFLPQFCVGNLASFQLCIVLLGFQIWCRQDSTVVDPPVRLLVPSQSQNSNQSLSHLSLGWTLEGGKLNDNLNNCDKGGYPTFHSSSAPIWEHYNSLAHIWD